ncbi:MAG: hypothetical protein U0414_11545 [Polyangiaceae bacterium]
MRRAALSVSVALLGCAAPPPSASAPEAVPRPRASAQAIPPKPKRHVEVQVYRMSMCPYAAKFLGTLGALRDAFDLDVRVDYVGTIDANGELGSMRGPNELTGDLLQVCTAKHTPKWLDVLLCQDADVAHVPDNWRSCMKGAGLDPSTIAEAEACSKGDEGKGLLAASFQSAKSRSVSSSPTIYVDGESYDGPRGPRGLLGAICGHWMTQPDACRSIPPLDVTILSDARCPDCAPEILKGSLEGRLDAPTIRMLDVASPEGATLYAQLGVADVPAVIVDANADLGIDAPAFATANRVGNYRFYSTSDWNPRCNAPGGCELSECARRLACRVEEPLTIDLFMMGLCPFAAKGVLALGELVDELGTHGVTPNVRVHFIGSGTAATTFTSLHGPREVDEDLRDVCLFDRYPDSGKFLPYLRCRAKDLTQEWKRCTGAATGIDAAVIDACATSAEGKRLLERSFADSAAEGIEASPSWIANGKYAFRGTKIGDIKPAFCAHNAVEGCSTP